MSKSMKQFTDSVVNALNNMSDEKFPWVKPWRDMDTTYRNAFSNRKYSGLHNILTCAMSEFTDCRYATFNQIRQEGGKLKMGTKATRLIAWRINKIKQDDGTEKEIPLATSWCLFNVEQIEGIDFPDINKDILNKDLIASDDVLQIYSDLKVNYKHDKSNIACYKPSSDNIVLPHVQQYDELDKWINTALHELVHWTATRVKRDCSNYSFDTEARAMEELVAELGAMFLSMQLNVNGYMNEQNLIYINSWKNTVNGKNGNRFIYKACKLAEESCKYIMANSNVFQKEEVAEM